MTGAMFATPLRLEDIDGEEAVLLEPLLFYSAQHQGLFMVGAGFRTDFASIPRGLWNILPKRGAHDPAAVLHDAAYRGELRTQTGQRVRLIKSLADDLFMEAMIARGVGRVSRWLMYQAVVWFGGAAYKGVPENV